MTGDQCAETARRLSEGLQRLGVAVAPHQTLGRMISQAEMLAKCGKASVFEDFAAASSARQHQIGEAALAMEQAERIAAALDVSGSIRNFKDKQRWLKKGVDRLASQDAKGLDYLFEIEVAGRLARWPGLDVAFEEPDIAFSLGTERVYVACKRPRTVEGVPNAIADARDQVGDLGGSAIVIIGTEAIFHHLPEGPRRFRFRTPDDGSAAAKDAFEIITDAAQEEARRTITKTSATRVLMFLGVFTYYADEPSSYCRREFAQGIVGRGDEEGARLLAQLKKWIASSD